MNITTSIMNGTSAINKTNSLYNNTINPFLNKILFGIIILVIGFIISKILSKIVKVVIKELEFDKILKKIGLNISLEKIASLAVLYVGYIVTIVLMLNFFGITSFLLNLLTVIIVLVLVIAFILGLKDFIPNFMASIHIKNKQTFRRGDTIILDNVKGIVKEINYLETIVLNNNKEELHIPNSKIIKDNLKVKKRKRHYPKKDGNSYEIVK